MNPSNGHSSEDSAKRALATVRSVLERAELNPMPVENGNGFRVGFKGDGPPVSGVAYVFGESYRFAFYIELLEAVRKKYLPKVAEFITRANYGIVIGNFELDYTTGGVRYKTSIDFRDSELPGELVRNSILAAMDGLELYFDALKRVMQGEQDPDEAVKEVEEPLDLD